MNAKQIWQAALGELQVKVPGPSFQTWLKNTSIVALEGSEGKRVAVIAVPSNFAKEWLENKFHKPITETLHNVLGYRVEVRFEVRTPPRGEQVRALHALDGLADTQEEMRMVAGEARGGIRLVGSAGQGGQAQAQQTGTPRQIHADRDPVKQQVGLPPAGTGTASRITSLVRNNSAAQPLPSNRGGASGSPVPVPQGKRGGGVAGWQFDMGLEEASMLNPRYIFERFIVGKMHGYRRAFVHVGAGPALLLIHGIGDSSDTWRELIPELARDHTGDRARPARPRPLRQAARRLLGRRATPTAMRDLLERARHRARHGGRALARRRRRDAVRLSVSRALRAARAGRAAAASRARCNPLLRLASRAERRSGAAAAAACRGARSARAARSGCCERWTPTSVATPTTCCACSTRCPTPPSRRAFVRTLRAVVDWRGQVDHHARSLLPDARHADAAGVGRARRRDPVRARARSRTRRCPAAGSRSSRTPGHFPHHSDPARFIAVLRDFLASTAPGLVQPERVARAAAPRPHRGPPRHDGACGPRKRWPRAAQRDVGVGGDHRKAGRREGPNDIGPLTLPVCPPSC